MSRLILDLEANSLEKPDKIWLIVCKDIDTGEFFIFREVTSNEDERRKAEALLHKAELVVGHNLVGYDRAVMYDLLAIDIPIDRCCDTLIVSRMCDYSKEGGHSLDSYGKRFGIEKLEFSDWSKYSEEMEEYCVRDVEICHRVYLAHIGVINDPKWALSLSNEHNFQIVVNRLHSNGFCFDVVRARDLLNVVERDLAELDKEILNVFVPRLKLVREIHPKLTRYGTLNKSDFRWFEGDDLSEFNGGPFCRCEWAPFNPSSHKQIVEVLHNAGWSPTEKTTTHLELERKLGKLKRAKKRTIELDLRLKECYDALKKLEKYGWKINEENLATLPASAPAPARTLAKRILLESRRRTLTEWLGLVHPDTGRIHGEFAGIGTWTHRMATRRPNTQNIPNEFELDGSKKLYGKELRSFWRAPKNRLLVGVDAEGIQLRIFAHYIDDEEFTHALVRGKKSDKTDPHSLNQRIMGNVCKSRAAAKRFIYALLLGAGLGKLAEILECSRDEAQEALDCILERYTGFAHLKKTVIPQDARRGFFYGLDGRQVSIPSETVGGREHLCMSGYLQNGEAVIMKMATLKWIDWLDDVNSYLVNMIHDEWQTETPNDMAIAVRVAEVKAESLKTVGEELGLRCPLAGSYWNDDYNDYSIGVNWSQTH